MRKNVSGASKGYVVKGWAEECVVGNGIALIEQGVIFFERFSRGGEIGGIKYFLVK